MAKSGNIHLRKCKNFRLQAIVSENAKIILEQCNLTNLIGFEAGIREAE